MQAYDVSHEILANKASSYMDELIYIQRRVMPLVPMHWELQCCVMVVKAETKCYICTQQSYDLSPTRFIRKVKD